MSVNINVAEIDYLLNLYKIHFINILSVSFNCISLNYYFSIQYFTCNAYKEINTSTVHKK